jgi:predicted dehydrogenase
MKDQSHKAPTHRKLTRREILRGAAAAATAPYVLTSGALGAASLAPASDRITVACVGVRNRGGRHLKNLLANGEVEVLAVCDVDRAVRQRAVNRVAGARARRWSAPGRAAPDQTGDFRQIAARGDVDAVVIATPDHTHAVIALEMLRAGLSVYVEKPIALTIREGRAIAAAAARGLVVQVGCQRRSSPKHRMVCDLVRRGALGRLVRIEVGIPRRWMAPTPWSPEPVPAGFDYDAWLGPAPLAPYTAGRCHYNWRFIRDYSGGELTGPAFHGLDLAQWAIAADEGGPVAVEGEGECYEAGLYDAFYRVNVQWTYANGVKLICRSGSVAATRLVGTDGWLDADSLRASSPEILAACAAAGDGQPKAGASAGPSHMRNFLSALRAGRAGDAAAGAEPGHRSATLCHLGQIAMRLGRRLRWDPAGECFPDDPEAQEMTHRPYRPPWTL